MGKTIIFKCTLLDTNIYSGAMVANAAGYYEGVTLGALDVYNSAGEYYELSDMAAELFHSSRGFMSKIKAGYLKSEMGHPKIQPGENPQAFLSRARRITEKNVCSFIKEVRLETTTLKVEGKSKPIVLIKGDVKPAGKYAKLIKEVMEDEHANSAYSIRAFTDVRTVNGVVYKSLAEIITWDWVTEPGIAVANKLEGIRKISTEEYEAITTSAIDLTGGLIGDNLPGIYSSEDYEDIGVPKIIPRTILDW